MECCSPDSLNVEEPYRYGGLVYWLYYWAGLYYSMDSDREHMVYYLEDLLFSGRFQEVDADLRDLLRYTDALPREMYRAVLVTTLPYADKLSWRSPFCKYAEGRLIHYVGNEFAEELLAGCTVEPFSAVLELDGCAE